MPFLPCRKPRWKIRYPRSVLVLVALGGCFSEHSGVVNIGLEGIMVIGALGGALMMKYVPAGLAAPVVILLVILSSVLIGMLFSLLLGVAAIRFKADQTLVGTALNLPDFSSLLSRNLFSHSRKKSTNPHR